MPELIEVESARQLILARALGRTIRSVYAPDPWYLKRGLTVDVVRGVLPGLQFVTARRRGKLLMVDTASESDDGPVLSSAPDAKFCSAPLYGTSSPRTRTTLRSGMTQMTATVT